MIKTNTIKKPVLFNSIMLALFIDVPCLNQLLITFNLGFESVMTILYVGIIVSMFISSRFTEKVRFRNSKRAYVILFIYVIALYSFTIYFGEKPFTSLSYFAVFTVTAFLISQLIVVDSEVVIKATLLLAAPAVVKINDILFINSTGIKGMSMDQSYAFLVPISASVIYIFCYFKKDGRFRKILYVTGCVLNSFFLIEMLMFGSRGSILSIMLLIWFIYVIKLPNDDACGIMVNKRKLVIGSIAVIVCAFLFIPILGIIQDLFASRGLYFQFINKTLNLTAEGDVSNGRSILFPLVFQEFLNRPIFGHGFDVFNKTGLYEYPHNFILQIIYDGGIVMILVMLVPMISRMFSSFKQYNRNQLIFLIFIIFISVPGASFSGDLWQQSNLWILAGMLLGNNRMIV